MKKKHWTWKNTDLCQKMLAAAADSAERWLPSPFNSPGMGYHIPSEMDHPARAAARAGGLTVSSKRSKRSDDEDMILDALQRLWSRGVYSASKTHNIIEAIGAGLGWQVGCALRNVKWIKGVDEEIA